METLQQKYDRLEDINDHTGAAMLLVNNFGTKEEQKIMKGIKARQLVNGHMTIEDDRLRFETSNKYYKLLSNLK